MVANNPGEHKKSGLQVGYFLHMLFKSLLVRKKRVAIAVFSVTIGALIITAFASIYFDISIKMSQELRTYGANFFAGPKASARERFIAASTYEDIVATIPPDKLVGGSPYLYGIARIDLGNVVMVGVNFSGLKKISPFWKVEGAWVSVDFDEKNCMVGASLAKRMELKTGQQITIISNETDFRSTLRVKGIVETGQAEDEQIIVNYSLAQKILGVQGRINHAMLSIISQGFDVDAFARKVQAQHPQTDARSIRKVSYSEGKILNKIQGLMALIALVILATTTLCVMTTLMAMVVERNREIGLMKALGADNTGIVWQFLTETAIIALAGVLLGLAGGFLLAQVLGQAVFNSSISFRPVVIPLTLGISMTAAFIAAAIPVRMAVNVSPAHVLRGE